MKTKLSTILVIMLLTAQIANTQEIKRKTYTVDKTTQRVVISRLFGDIKLIGHDGNNLIIEGVAAKPLPERAEGLQPILYSEDNTGLGISVKQSEAVFEIIAARPQSKSGEFTIKIPKNLNVELNYIGFNAKEISIENFSSELIVRSQTANVLLKNITGPTVISNVSGNIEADFSQVNQQKPISITTISGFVDVTLPGKTPANLKLKSISGEIYTNFDVKFNHETKSDMFPIGGANVRASINSGGVDIQLESISGNVYLRKK